MRSFLKFSVLLLGVALLLNASPQEKKAAPVESITRAELRDHIFYLASDALEGRYFGSRGYEIAAHYGASQFLAAGVEPLIPGGEGMTYLQDVPVAKRSFKGHPVLKVKTPKGEVEFAHDQDFKWVEGDVLRMGEQSYSIVNVGYGISEPEHGWDDFAGLDLAGKVIIMSVGAPLKEGRPVLPDDVHKKYATAAGWQNKLMPLISDKLAGAFFVADQVILGAWDNISGKAQGTRTVYDSKDEAVFKIPMICAMKPEMAEVLFQGQEFSFPKEGQQDLAGYKNFELKDVRLSLQLAYEDETVPTWNVVGIVKGSDPVLSQEYITVTAHLDHLVPRKEGQIFNGADDNASGSAGVLEIAEAVAMNPPKRSVIFVLFALEEGGVIGSQHFVSACPVPIDKVVVNLNLDMIGRSDRYSQEDRTEYALDSDKITPELKKLIQEVNARTVNWSLKYERAPNAPGVGSDNLVFDAIGIPGVFFFSGAHPDYHRVTDDPEKIDYEKVQKVSQLVYELTMEIGNKETLW
jgi:hypothetical protein